MPRSQTQLRGPKDRSSKKPAQKPKRKNARAMNALSIAEQENPTKLGVRRNRLGFYDDGQTPKRYSARNEDEDDEDDEPTYKRRRTNTEPDENHGSDSEGHEWTLGQVDSDDDSELDSDEALGSSDEERFEGYTFRGSSKSKPAKSKKPTSKKHAAISLSEDVESEEESLDNEEDEEDDDLGEDAVDLATAWDMNTAEEEADAKRASKKAKKAALDIDSEGSGFGSGSGSESDSESDSEGESEGDESDDTGLSFSDDEDDTKTDGLSKLQDFVNSMATTGRKKSSQKSQEQAKPSEYGLTSSRKLTSSLKHVDATPELSKAGIPGKLDAPLAKRQQDKLDRSAAYEKSKETLDRWLETVKANRRAEHLSFPLPDPDAGQVDRIQVVKPANDLETTIQSILAESGLVESNGKSAEDQVQNFENLEARKLPIEEIQARRAELRKRRDLLFREEVRAKRIKKIKSKSFRRVHRKERERLEQQERQAMLEAGVDMDEADRDKNERRRAKARMGSKHRDSKWAKSLKETGRTAWDEEARNNAADLALREEELRKRIEGKRVTTGDDDYLGALEKTENNEEIKGPHSNLFNMKFMQNAEASRKAENDAEIRRLNRELRGEESQSEAESEVGRRKFGQSKKTGNEPKIKAPARNDFEEAPDSDEEDQGADHSGATPMSQRVSKMLPRPSQAMFSEPKEKLEENPWLVSTERTNRRRTGGDANDAMDIILDDEPPQPAKEAAPKQNKASKAVQAKKRSRQDDSDEEENEPVLLKNHDLVKRAFAGDEVVQGFAQEKMDTIEDEGDKVKSQKNKKRFLTTVEGVKPEQRKDAKLSRVIINQKRVKKNTKYMASQLPHEFESKAQYERSLRMPLGPEWSTKETYQDGTKPRILMKPGIIKPMEKPMV
ncbi:small nucleolar ribonucleoprotein complex subunit Utp14 [Penicillium chermesinum]|nr:small nucleolar ribonucleoprotein complex subunit Utp14 [Penicillium chermesinum]